MYIFSHRGVFDKCPENSLAAFKIALDSGFSVEIDLRLTSDNDFVVIHDDNLKRLFQKNISVASGSLLELSKYSLVSFRKYCELFKMYFTDSLTAIHFKLDSQTDVGFKLISQYFSEFNLYDRAFIFDLTIDSAFRMRKVDPKVKIAFIISEYKFESTVYLWDEVKDIDFDIVWAAEYHELYSEEFIKKVKKTDRHFYAMSPDVHKAPHILHPRAYSGYEKTWTDLIRWGSEGVCTDLPFEFKKLADIITHK